MKRLGKYLMSIFLIVASLAIPVEAEGDSIKVLVKGKYLDIIPIVENGRTLVPIRAISEELGFNVDYMEESEMLSIEKGNKNIKISIGSNKAIVDGKEMELDVKPFIKDGNTFVPLRFISESLGEEVIWDGKNEIVLVGKFASEYKVENTFLYFNKENRYTLSFPNSWKEGAVIETKDGILYVYDKKSFEKLKEDGIKSFGPVFEIRCSDYPIITTAPNDGDYVLYYNDGKYIEAIFGSDFQYYPETKDSYDKIFDEGQKTLGSFKVIDEDYSFVEDDKENYKKEIEILHDILDNFVPENIFNKNKVIAYKKPIPNTSFLYMKIMKDEEEVLIKIESDFDSDGKLTRYHLKNYWYDLKENKLSQSEALKLANDFVKRYIDESIEVIKKPDLYSSLYDKDKHETYGDKTGNCVVVVDLVHGFVEYFSYE